ncbi:MAG: hypothetical protein AAFQ87_27400, partial [Bacteroidota bacterium]
LELSNNQFSGLIPTSMGQLYQLQMLALNDNQLEGNVPDTFRNLRRLYSLVLTGNLIAQSEIENWNRIISRRTP